MSNINSGIEKYSEYSHTYITELEGNYFTFNAIKALNEVGIYTLKDLFSCEEKELINSLKEIRVKENIHLKNEIIGTIKILRCQFLNEDPKVPFNEPSKIDYKTDFGLSRSSLNVILRLPYSINKHDIFDIIVNKDYELLRDVRGAGNRVIDEIKLKTSIAFDYHKKHNSQVSAKEPIETEDMKNKSLSELRELYLELQRKTDLQKQANEQLTTINKKISEFFPDTLETFKMHNNKN